MGVLFFDLFHLQQPEGAIATLVEKEDLALEVPVAWFGWQVGGQVEIGSPLDLLKK